MKQSRPVTNILASTFLALLAIAVQTLIAQAPTRFIEDLNLQGADAFMPPFADSVIPVDSAFRRNLAAHGLALRVMTGTQYIQNTLAAPVAAHEQSYVGQRHFAAEFANPTLTADLRQLGRCGAQLNMSAVWNWVSWESASPKALQMMTLYLYKGFGEGRAQIKAGYTSNDIVFLGMQVGGSTATGAQGFYAVLPFEVGMSYFPTTAPASKPCLPPNQSRLAIKSNGHRNHSSRTEELSMKPIHALAAALVIPTPALAQNTNLADQLRGYDRQQREGALRGETRFEEQYTAADYVSISPSGAMSTRDQTLARMKSGDVKLDAIDVDQEQVHLYDDVAIITGREHVRGSFQGHAFDNWARYSRAWKQIDGAWKLVLFQETAIPAPAQ